MIFYFINNTAMQTLHRLLLKKFKIMLSAIISWLFRYVFPRYAGDS